MPHAALCVSGLPSLDRELLLASCFNAARGIMCVGTPNYGNNMMGGSYVSMPHAALCVSGHPKFDTERPTLVEFQCRTRHYVCRDRETCDSKHPAIRVSMPHAALCVSGREMIFAILNSRPGFNAARGIMCVGTLCPAALVPRGLRRRFGKTKR